MQVTILNDEHIRLTTEGDGLEVIGDGFGPLQMFATSLALCTASVVQQYGETAQLDLTGFGLEVAWQYVDDPYRVGSMAVTLLLPATVPPSRHKAIIRAADTCTIHNTLKHHPHMQTDVQVFDPATVQSEHAHHHDHQHHVHEA